MNNPKPAAPTIATESAAEALPARINDQPPIHFTENDPWPRHPRTNKEWNWRDDPWGDEGRLGEKRLNFAVDLSDPHAPDQMALVLRIDLMRIMARMQTAEAFKKYRLANESKTEAPDEPK